MSFADAAARKQCDERGLVVRAITSAELLARFRDGEAARRNLDEMRQTGISYTVDELRKEFGLS